MFWYFYIGRLNKPFLLAKDDVISALSSLHKSQGLNVATQTPRLERLLSSCLILDEKDSN